MRRHAQPDRRRREWPAAVAAALLSLALTTVGPLPCRCGEGRCHASTPAPDSLIVESADVVAFAVGGAAKAGRSAGPACRHHGPPAATPRAAEGACSMASSCQHHPPAALAERPSALASSPSLPLPDLAGLAFRASTAEVASFVSSPPTPPPRDDGPDREALLRLA